MSFKGYKDEENAYVKGVDDIVDYLKYKTIQELKTVDDFARKIESKREVGNKNLKEAIIASESKFIVIIDEWDLIYRDYREDQNLQIKFIEFLRGLFKNTDSLKCFSFVFLTGILPIKKYNSQSALNNFIEYNMLSPKKYEKYFGFTEEEVIEITKEPWCKLSIEELKSWYDGYKLNNVEIFNPTSVSSAVSNNSCESYWIETASNDEVKNLINKDFKGLKEDIADLIAGAKVPFSYRTFQNDMVTLENKNQIFSLLVCLGYLGCEPSGSDINGRIAYVPNKEIRQELNSILLDQEWFNSLSVVERSEHLFKAIKNLDSKTTEEIIDDIHNSSQVSILGYNTEESLTYVLMVALISCTENIYECYREVQSGHGFIDLVYVPKYQNNYPVMIFEFKKDASAEVALQQLKEKKICQPLLQR